ncbi:MAG: hypothetical protein WCJ69_17565 [Betaproteobacteria bacterium]
MPKPDQEVRDFFQALLITVLQEGCIGDTVNEKLALARNRGWDWNTVVRTSVKWLKSACGEHLEYPLVTQTVQLTLADLTVARWVCEYGLDGEDISPLPEPGTEPALTLQDMTTAPQMALMDRLGLVVPVPEIPPPRSTRRSHRTVPRVLGQTSPPGEEEPKVFFYPCSGADLLEPLDHFIDDIDEFWFVDRAYFCHNHQDVRGTGLDTDPAAVAPLVPRLLGYRRIDRRIDGRASGGPVPSTDDLFADLPDPWHREYRADTHIRSDALGKFPERPAACTLTETWEKVRTGRRVTIHLRRDHGVHFMLDQLQSFDVFMHRGDSKGEGGSAIPWLVDYDLLRELERRLRPDGQIVGDRVSTDDGAYLSSYTFAGHLGDRYGPTYIWDRLDRNAVA